LALILLSLATPAAVAQSRNIPSELKRYFDRQVTSLEQTCLAELESVDAWKEEQARRRRELQEMLGLAPWPERSPLEAVVTKTTHRDAIVVENLHFQSLPGLYVTANLYRPRQVDGRLPAILYVCGHGREAVDGVSHGNKTHYQHHGAWFARHGYVCLAIDTVQLGEIEGIHHGTYRYDMWWWASRGYTPAGVECWNGMRAIDYLQSRPEVDPERIGVTGRSGGGAYSWWVAALDERVKVAVPVAGITTLRDHVVEGCVEGHCDCMYPVNTYRWDFPMVAALVAPRPLLISNTDKDTIFPLRGVTDVYWKTREVYELMGAGDQLGLQITEGPHQDTQELRIHAFRWFNRFLKNDLSLVATPATPAFEIRELKVFDELPQNEQNTTIHESFVAQSLPTELPKDIAAWQTQRAEWTEHLRTQCFRGWPMPFGKSGSAPQSQEHGIDEIDGITLRTYQLKSEEDVDVWGWLAYRSDVDLSLTERVRLEVLGPADWGALSDALGRTVARQSLDGARTEKLSSMIRNAWEKGHVIVILVAPRGVGPGKWTDDAQKLRQIRRRFQLIGQTWDGMQIWDVAQAIRAIRSDDQLSQVPLTVSGSGVQAGIALYASLATDGVSKLELAALPTSHRDGPELLNVLKRLDLPQSVAMAAEGMTVELRQLPEGAGDAWNYVKELQHRLGWAESRFRF
jgi:dienelactone hydrolase